MWLLTETDQGIERAVTLVNVDTGALVRLDHQFVVADYARTGSPTAPVKLTDTVQPKEGYRKIRELAVKLGALDFQTLQPVTAP